MASSAALVVATISGGILDSRLRFEASSIAESAMIRIYNCQYQSYHVNGLLCSSPAAQQTRVAPMPRYVIKIDKTYLTIATQRTIQH